MSHSLNKLEIDSWNLQKKIEAMEEERDKISYEYQKRLEVLERENLSLKLQLDDQTFRKSTVANHEMETQSRFISDLQGMYFDTNVVRSSIYIGRGEAVTRN